MAGSGPTIVHWLSLGASGLALVVSCVSAYYSYRSSGNWKRQLRQQAIDKCVGSLHALNGAFSKFVEASGNGVASGGLAEATEDLWKSFRTFRSDYAVVSGYLPSRLEIYSPPENIELALKRFPKAEGVPFTFEQGKVLQSSQSDVNRHADAVEKWMKDCTARKARWAVIG